MDPDITSIVSILKRRRGGGDELFAYKQRGRWVDVKSADINAYVKEASGGDYSAKDFRTWGGTVLATVALAVSGPAAGTITSRKRAKARAVKEVARHLGNTPAVCRAWPHRPAHLRPLRRRPDHRRRTERRTTRATGRRSSARSRRPCST